MPKIHHGYNPRAEGDEQRIADIPMRYPLGALVGDITFRDGMVVLGSIPAGAVIAGAIVGVSSAFNASLTNVLTVGFGAGLDEIVAAPDVNEAAVGTTTVAHKGLAVPSVDLSVRARYAQTGTAATTGAARVVVLYAIPFSPWPVATAPAPGLEPNKVHFP